MEIQGVNLLFHLGLILFSATVFNYAARLLKQPPLLGYLLAGIFIGPFGLGSMGIFFGGIPIGVTTTDEILLLSELGVAFLLFSVGVESDISKLKELGKVAILGTLAQVGLTTALVILFNNFLGILSFEQALYLGLIMAFSSTTIVVKILSDARQLNTQQARLMIGFLLVQDFLVILAMPLLSNFNNIASSAVVLDLLFKVAQMLAIAFGLNRFIYPRLFAFAAKSEELFFLSAMSSVFIFIFLSYVLGFSIAVGAFIAGVTISTLPYNLEVLNRIRGLRDFLATIFFVTLGIQITPMFFNFPLQLAIFIIAIVFLLKPLVYFLTTIFSGFGGKVSLAVALGLAQVSEFSFIIAGQGRHILEQTPGLYPFIILVISISMALTPYLMNYSDSTHRAAEKHLRLVVKGVRRIKYLYRKIDKLSNVSEKHTGHIIIFGAGTVGSGIIAAFLKDHDVIAVDSDPEIASAMVKQGINCIYGSDENPDVWQTAGLSKAKMVVVSTPYTKATLRLVSHVKRTNPKAVVFARCHYFRDALALYESGADYVIMPQVAGTNLFIRKMTEHLAKGKAHGIGAYQGAFMQYLREKAKEEHRGLIELEAPRYS